jgi:hypothetical protein
MSTKVNIRIIAASAILIVWLMPFLSYAQTVPTDTAFYNRYPYIRFLTDDQMPDTLTDEEFIDIAAKIIFPINKYDLPKSNEVLRQLAEEVIPQMNRDSLRLMRMVFRGAASPEGPYRWNKFLGEQRAQALYDYVKQQTALATTDSLSATLVEVEDYPLLCVLMKRASDPDYSLVKNLTDKYLRQQNYGQLKQELQRAKGGKLWQRLLKTYFPQLRAARFVLYIQKAPVLTLQEPPLTPPSVERDTIQQVLPIEGEMSEGQKGSVLLPRREVLSVKTNLLFDFAYMPGYDRWCPIPNIAIEYYPLHGHFTFGASFDMPWWQHYDEHKFFQLRNYQLETRYYFRSGSIEKNPPGKGAAFRGFYLQAYAHLGVFGICFDDNRGWVGEGGGAGIGLGYVLPLSKKGHWRLEFGLQAGFFFCKYDPYQYENPVNPQYRDNLYYYKWTQKPELFKKRQYHRSWFGPTRVGITLVYDLLYRRIQKKGVSFYSTERRVEP